MKGVSELTDFYYKTLYPDLQKLEKEREALKKKIYTIGFFYTLFALSLAIFFFSHSNSFDTFIFVGFAYVGVGGFIYKILIKDYTSEFKLKVIEPLISALDKNLRYSPHTHVQQRTFLNSKLFKSIDRMSGNDYVSGKIDDIPIEFSDIHAEKKHKDSKGRTSYSTVFQGLFIKSEFNKNFKGSTVVLPDLAQNLFGDYLGNFLQSSNMGRAELVTMDSVEFLGNKKEYGIEYEIKINNPVITVNVDEKKGIEVGNLNIKAKGLLDAFLRYTIDSQKPNLRLKYIVDNLEEIGFN